MPRDAELDWIRTVGVWVVVVTHEFGALREYSTWKDQPWSEARVHRYASTMPPLIAIIFANAGEVAAASSRPMPRGHTAAALGHKATAWGEAAWLWENVVVRRWRRLGPVFIFTYLVLVKVYMWLMQDEAPWGGMSFQQVWVRKWHLQFSWFLAFLFVILVANGPMLVGAPARWQSLAYVLAASAIVGATSGAGIPCCLACLGGFTAPYAAMHAASAASEAAASTHGWAPYAVVASTLVGVGLVSLAEDERASSGAGAGGGGMSPPELAIGMSLCNNCFLLGYATHFVLAAPAAGPEGAAPSSAMGGWGSSSSSSGLGPGPAAQRPLAPPSVPDHWRGALMFVVFILMVLLTDTEPKPPGSLNRHLTAWVWCIGARMMARGVFAGRGDQQHGQRERGWLDLLLCNSALHVYVLHFPLLNAMRLAIPPGQRGGWSIMAAVPVVWVAVVLACTLVYAAHERLAGAISLGGLLGACRAVAAAAGKQGGAAAGGDCEQQQGGEARA